MFLNHARLPWAGLDWEHGVSAMGSRCRAAQSWSTTRASECWKGTWPRNWEGSTLHSRHHWAPPPSHSPTPNPSLNFTGLLRRLVTFTVKLNRGALCQAGAPGTEVDGTTLQHSWLAGVSLGCPHQHTDPVEGKVEAVQCGSYLALLQSPKAGRTQTSGPGAGWGVDAPWVVFIS